MTPIQLTALTDGPQRLRGDVTIPDRGSPVCVCRCGRSAGKPCCDGSHAWTIWRVDA